jgi:hypothetical protein
MDKRFLLNAFSLQMVAESKFSVNVTEITERQMWTYGWYDERPFSDEGGIANEDRTMESFWVSGIESAIGHEDTAKVLRVKCNRQSVTLKIGDTAYVAQLVGGRLPEGSTTLPEGYTFKFFRVEILKQKRGRK